MAITKHFFTEQEGLHVGLHRDEIGCYESKSHGYVFLNGYFFELNRGSYDLLKEDVDNHGEEYDVISRNWTWTKDNCFAYIDRKNSILLVKNRHYYERYLKAAGDFCKNIYSVKSFPFFDMTSPSKKRVLYKEIAKAAIYEWVTLNADCYKVVNTCSKNALSNDWINEAEKEYKTTLIELVKHRRVNTKVNLFEKPITIYTGKRHIQVEAPTVDQILDGTVFTPEEKLHIEKCKVYTKYFYGEGHTWAELNKMWGTTELDDYIRLVKLNRETNEKLSRKCREDSMKSYEEALRRCEEESKFSVDDWRKGLKNSFEIDYYSYSVTRNNLIRKKKETMRKFVSFPNVQLKLCKDNKSFVVTSKMAMVRLEPAIRMFNWLYETYMSKNVEYKAFDNDNIRLDYYRLRFIKYQKKSDNRLKELGYCDWRIQIGCHAIWMEEVKDFCRYYHLEDKVKFDCTPIESAN